MKSFLFTLLCEENLLVHHPCHSATLQPPSSMNNAAILSQCAAQQALTISSDVVYKTTKALVIRLSKDSLLQIDARCSEKHMTSLDEKMADNHGVQKINILAASSTDPIIAASLEASGVDAAQIDAIVSSVADTLTGRDPHQSVCDLLDQHLSSLNLVSLIGANVDLDVEKLLELAKDKYFRYVMSPDCSSCRSSIFDTVSNRNSLSNDDVYGDRTAYYMTGALFGCNDVSAKQPDCAWDYDRLDCSSCTLKESDAVLGYHATVFPEAYAAENTRLCVCGVYPQSAYATHVPQDQAECANMLQPLKPSLGDDGRFCACYKPEKGYNAYIKWRRLPKAFDQVQADWDQR